jgi:hypothetical protein
MVLNWKRDGLVCRVARGDTQTVPEEGKRRNEEILYLVVQAKPLTRFIRKRKTGISCAWEMKFGSRVR